MARPTTLPDIAIWDDMLPVADGPSWRGDEVILVDGAMENPAVIRALIRRVLFPEPWEGKVVDPLLQAAWLCAYPEDHPDGPPDTATPLR